MTDLGLLLEVEHDRLYSRLGSVFLHIAEGDPRAADRDLRVYEVELRAHLGDLDQLVLMNPTTLSPEAETELEADRTAVEEALAETTYQIRHGGRPLAIKALDRLLLLFREHVALEARILGGAIRQTPRTALTDVFTKFH